MSIELNPNNSVAPNTETILAVKTANLTKSQTELAGEMALTLIASASVSQDSLPVVGNVGQKINIKV